MNFGNFPTEIWSENHINSALKTLNSKLLRRLALKGLYFNKPPFEFNERLLNKEPYNYEKLRELQRSTVLLANDGELLINCKNDVTSFLADLLEKGRKTFKHPPSIFPILLTFIPRAINKLQFEITIP